ncbi:DUF1212-domain-containing protein [Mycena venus]|uniref:DUF1212-domain-containing protein n=1 Tax=Mycena venus TaxID=2733690 RepID=A0A8H6YF27_9AGAR|nr:DUF1212-domain-containing protein [Mycena venus]
MSARKGDFGRGIEVMTTAGSKTPPTGIMTGRDSPPGASGSKTPRKVQWMDTREERPEESTHALDEHGKDPNAFENLTTALERHQSESPAGGPRIHYFPPRRVTLPPPINTDPSAEQHAHPHALSTATTASSDGELSGPPSPTHSVPGNYISPHEDAGLPGTSDLEDYSRRAANQVVRAHTRKGFLSSFGAKRANLRKKKAAREGTGDDYPLRAQATSDVEQDLSGAAPMNPALGGGVLSALLTLYNDAEGTNSGASTPGIEEPPELPWITPPSSTKTPLAQVEGVPRATASSSEHESSTSPSPPSADPIGRTHARSGSQTSLVAKLHLLPPKKPRNSAGVLGALIASTGNISGAAAPVPSQLAPNIKRPGYHLSRYSVQEDDAPQVPAPAPKAAKERPKSMPPISAPPTPGNLKWTSTMSSYADTLASKRGWTEKLNDLGHATFGGRSGRGTPVQTPSSGTDHDEWIDEKWFREQEQRKEKRRKRKKAEVYITRHVAQIIQRQEFILKLTRALMMFGGPSHRLQAQIQSTGRVLDIQVNCMYLPDVVLISFDDSSTGTSNLKFIRQGSSLSLGKLNEVYELYWSVIHDEQSVSEASSTLDALMRKKQEYSWWQLVLMGGMCSASICSVGFNGSFIDSLIVFPLGALLVAIQLLSIRNELYSNIFEITVATLFSFLSAALASTGFFCYSAVASSSVVLILPGFIVLCGSLEIMSRNIISGSVRMCYAVVYSLFLGFGLAIGAEAYEKITSKTIIGSTDYACSISHDAHGAWYQRTPSLYWAFLTVPMYSLFLSMRNQAPWRNREMILLIGISCIGWVTNHFTGIKFQNQSDITAAVGQVYPSHPLALMLGSSRRRSAFTVGFVANMYARFFSGNAFVIMITGILFQLPSGLGNGGLLTYASEKTAGKSTSYLSGFQTALQLISVAIGLTVGLGLALAVVHPIQSRRRAGGVFSL